MTDAAGPDGFFAPPYFSFETFKNFLSSLNPNALPPRIDRSMMRGIAGGTQTNLIVALRQFSLVGDQNRVEPTLVEMVQSPAAIKASVAKIIETYYASQMQLSREQGTTDQLVESFKASGYSGSTIRKAVTFFLHAARFAEVPLSPHFRSASVQTRESTSTRARRPKITLVGEQTPASPVQQTTAEAHTVELDSGGTVQIVCSTSFLSLTRSDRDFVFELVDRLKAYEGQRGSLPTSDLEEALT